MNANPNFEVVLSMEKEKTQYGSRWELTWQDPRPGVTVEAQMRNEETFLLVRFQSEDEEGVRVGWGRWDFDPSEVEALAAGEVSLVGEIEMKPRFYCAYFRRAGDLRGDEFRSRSRAECEERLNRWTNCPRHPRDDESIELEDGRPSCWDALLTMFRVTVQMPDPSSLSGV